MNNDRRNNNNVNNSLEDHVVGIKRVSKTVTGGRRASFAALVIVGDRAGHVGYGTGKALDVSQSVEKAKRNALDNMITVPLKDDRTFYHDITMKVGAGKVLLKPAQPGKGIIAGGAMRYILDLLGVQDVVAKSIGSSNPNSMVRATFKALEAMQSPRQVNAIRKAPVKNKES
ncbi:MAG: 30S ribosomal protein S5 [Alphaproteobacteria bacterium]|nr:30S ribosomal protein S5 [Alphaproteobacteria bacterium]MBL0718182.1 30S ribosomal protein S5 [Alphaproteobacteria bacterium]